MEQAYTIRRLREDEVQAALDLTWEVFLEFEAPDYSEEGVQTFRAYLNDTEKTSRLLFYGAFDGDTLIGTICTRPPQHIGGFFVKGSYHRKGIGRALFEAIAKEYDKQEFTVNSSPYAVEIYRRLGFFPIKPEQFEDGIRYTPMIYRKDYDTLELRTCRNKQPEDEPDTEMPPAAEFYINGTALLDIIREIEAPFCEQEDCTNLIAAYGYRSKKNLAYALEQGLEPGSYEYDCGTELYCCSGCFDPGCWSVLCSLRADGDSILMTDFRQNHRPNWKYPIGYRFTKENFFAELDKLKSAE